MDHIMINFNNLERLLNRNCLKMRCHFGYPSHRTMSSAVISPNLDRQGSTAKGKCSST